MRSNEIVHIINVKFKLLMHLKTKFKKKYTKNNQRRVNFIKLSFYNKLTLRMQKMSTFLLLSWFSIINNYLYTSLG